MKKIKKLLLASMMLLGSMAFTSCNEVVDGVLQKGIEEAKKELPMTAGDGLVVDDITLGENGIVYHVTVDEDVIDMDILKSAQSELKDGIKEGLSTEMYDDQDLKDFLEAAAQFGKPINYKYEGNTSGETVRIKISVDELKQMVE